MKKSLIALLAVALVSGCTIPTHLFQSKKTDYKAEATTNPGLDVPPDLTPVQTDERFAIPGEDTSATLSHYNASKNTAAATHPTPMDHSGVLPTFGDQVSIAHEGDQRWLVIHQTAEKIWPTLEGFWTSQGFKLQSDDPKAGVMETEWTDNRHASPQSTLGQMVNNVVSNLFSSPVRDQFRVRIERVDADHTELYLFHKGMEEMLDRNNYTGGLWQPLPDDPEIETEYLKKLAVTFGESADQAATLVANVPAPTQAKSETTTSSDTQVAKPVAHGAELTTATDGNTTIIMKDSFDRAWRRVGLALDRSAFTVEDRDRAAGVYFIRYTTDEENRKKNSGESFISKLAFWRSEDKTQDTQTYRLNVSTTSGHGTTVDIRNKDESASSPATVKRILTLIYDQLH